VTLEVLSYLFQDPSFPLNRVKLFKSIQMLLLPFKSLVKLEVIEFGWSVLQGEDLGEKGFFLLGQGYAVES
jgi:hypothetical protein